MPQCGQYRVDLNENLPLNLYFRDLLMKWYKNLTPLFHDKVDHAKNFTHLQFQDVSHIQTPRTAIKSQLIDIADMYNNNNNNN